MKVLVIDTEANRYQKCYDIGWCIYDTKTDSVIDWFSALVRDHYKDYHLRSAYYVDKVDTHYTPMLEMGLIDIYSLRWIKTVLQWHMSEVDYVTAYNIAYDKNVIGKNFDLELKGKKGGFCLMKMVQGISPCTTKRYKDFCVDNGFLTEKAKKPKTSAEVVYRYLQGNPTFEEDHTAYSDALIELDIYKHVRRQKKKMSHFYF